MNEKKEHNWDTIASAWQLTAESSLNIFLYMMDDSKRAGRRRRRTLVGDSTSGFQCVLVVRLVHRVEVKDQRRVNERRAAREEFSNARPALAYLARQLKLLELNSLASSSSIRRSAGARRVVNFKRVETDRYATPLLLLFSQSPFAAAAAAADRASSQQADFFHWPTNGRPSKRV